MMPNLTQTLRLALALSLCALAVPSTVRAATNVVPNPGFEETMCSNDALPCAWHPAEGDMGVSTWQPHSGGANLWVWSWSYDSALAVSDCVPLGPGGYAASFWHRETNRDPYWGVSFVGLGATFYPKARCGGSGSPSVLAGGFSPIGDGLWYPELGYFEPPVGTVSVKFDLEMNGWCDGGCFGVGAEFDDVVVESSADAPRRVLVPQPAARLSTASSVSAS